MFSLDLEALVDLIPPAGPDVFFRSDFGDSIINSIRVDSFSGELLTVPLDTGTGVMPHVLSPSRQRREMTVVRLAPDGQLECSLPEAGREVGFSCSEAHRIKLLGRDPFSIATTTDGAGRTFVAVGALTAETLVGGLFDTKLSVMTTDYLEQRLRGELPLFDGPEDCNVNDAVLPLNFFVRGLTGILPLPPLETSTAARFLSLAALIGGNTLRVLEHETTLRLDNEDDDTGGLNPNLSCVGDDADNVNVATRQRLALGVEISAFQTRGWVASSDGTRVYASVRFQDSVDTTNAGIVVMSVDGEEVTFVNAVEVGEELGRPSLLEREDGARLIYVGDQRFDQVYVVDVTTDAPDVVARIDSRGLRDFDGELLQVNLLDQPTQIVFVGDEDRRLALVSNFLNSTLGVIDITDPDPRQHRVIARLGRDLDPQGDSEGP